MKLVTVLTAVSLHPKYLRCVPYFLDFWLSHNSITGNYVYEPKILVIADQLPTELLDYRKWCVIHPVAAEMSSVFASQNIRILWPGLMGSDFVLTTDIDMFPLGDQVFNRALELLESGADFVVCRDVLPPGQYPICYNFASPSAWREVSGVNSALQASMELADLFQKTSLAEDYKGEHGGAGWFVDQRTLYGMIERFESNGGKVSKLSDIETGHRRLDRRILPSPLHWLALPFIQQGFFSDYHVHQPIEKHAKYLDSVLKRRRDLVN